MSDNPTHEPSLDARLPDDLARCESMLAGMSLPPSGVSRDELLYRAGWAAAEAHASSAADPGSAHVASAASRGRRMTLAWSLASAAMAASLTLAITWRFQPAAPTPASTIVEVPPSTPAVAADHRATPPRVHVLNIFAESLADAATPDRTASLWAIRNRALVGRWDDPWIAAERPSDATDASLADDTVTPPLSTSRAMLQELLPARSEQDASSRAALQRWLNWPWNTLHSGDTT